MKDKHSIGFVASRNVDAKDIGLPIYPGAKLYKESSDDDPAIQLGAWANSSAFKLVVLKMQTTDKPDKVALFYHEALGKYGTVLNCSAAESGPAKKTSDKSLACDDQLSAGELELKAGRKDDQHVVSIEPHESGTRFSLVYVESSGSSDN